MPMVGIVSCAVSSAARSSGMPSSTMANAPAASTASASSIRRSRWPGAEPRRRPCTLWPPMRCTDCGVRPMWPITGMSTDAMRSIVSATARAALELHRLGAALLDQAAGVGHRVGRAHLVGQERQVGDEQRAAPRPRHHAGVIDHLVHRHRQRGVEALHDHAERVADQDEVDARLVGDARERDSRTPSGRRSAGRWPWP